MQRFHFTLRISAAEMRRYYSGQADKVVVRSDEGAVLHLHPRHLRPYVDALGLSGRFLLELDSEGSVKTLQRF